ncbi:hypothetical protein PTNB85_05141 [Pyrenophora teres f. teres]|nr:hypothetical protein PTNB85_05141 [Pyrenophora teres f. teres]KAE8862629.1 hypothetical protein PTNB29_05191 [Pyrenophora teres f. teres]
MLGDGKTKLIAVSPYEMTLVMTRTRDKDVPFEPEGAVDGNGGETDEGDVNVEARVLEDRITKLSKELVSTVFDEEETFALGIRVANVAEEPGIVTPIEGVIKELDDVIEKLYILEFRLGRIKLVERLPAKDDPELGKGVSRGRVAVKLGDMDIGAEGSRSDVDTRPDDEIDKVELSDSVRPGDCSVDMPDTLRVPGPTEGLSNEIVNSSVRVDVKEVTVVDSFERKELQENKGAVLGCSLSSELVAIVGIEVVGRTGLDVNSTGEDNGSFTVIEVLVIAVDEPSGTADVNVETALDVCSTAVSVGSPGDKAEDTVGSALLTELVESPGGILVIVVGKSKEDSEPKVGAILDRTLEEISEIVDDETEAELTGIPESSGAMDALESKIDKTEVDKVNVNNVDTEPENTLLITTVAGGYGG